MGEWVATADEEFRYEILLRIDTYHVQGAASGLHQLAWRLDVTPTEQALRDLERVKRSLERLGPGNELPRPPETPLEAFRREIAHHCQLVYDETDWRRDGDQVPRRLGTPYERFDENERLMAEQIFSDWLMSNDGETRVTTRRIIDYCKITALLPQLRILLQRLAETDIPDERSERDAVERLITKLSGLQPKRG